MRLKASIILALLVSFNIFAQTDPLTLQYAVSGTVIDSENSHALQFVVVTIPGLKIATVTNADGGFVIKSHTRPQELEFTLLGYKSARVAVEPGAQGITVRMERNNLTLNEAVVVSGNPYTIMETAISRIKDNYPSSPELFDCFYRETIQKRHRYIFISEAVSRLYKTSYRRETFDGDRVTVDKSRILMSPSSRDTLSVKVVGGPTQAVNLDFVKNNDLLDRRDLENYVLKMEAPSMIGDRYQFAIRLIPAKETPYPLYEGLVYIDRETYAFTRFDLNLDMSDLDKATKAILISKPAGLRFKPTEVALRFDYSMDGNICRTSYVRTVIRFQCDWKRRLIKTDFTAVSELVTTDRHDPEGQVITRKEAFGRRDALSDKADFDFDPEFWKDYNIIEPTESLDRAISRIKKQTERK